MNYLQWRVGINEYCIHIWLYKSTVAVMGNNQQVTFSNGDTWKEINLKANHNPTDKWEKAYIDFNIPLEIEEEVIMPAREGNLEGWPKEF